MEKEDIVTGSESDSEPEASVQTLSDLPNDLGQWGGINTAVREYWVKKGPKDCQHKKVPDSIRRIVPTSMHH